MRELPTANSAGTMVIALRESLLRDPLPLIATIAHEPGHVILLGGRLLDPATPDHEQLTDLLTVFLGFGNFSSTSAALFRQYQDTFKQGCRPREPHANPTLYRTKHFSP